MRRVGYLESRRAIRDLRRLRDLVYRDFGYGTGLTLAAPLKELVKTRDVPEIAALAGAEPDPRRTMRSYPQAQPRCDEVRD